MSQHSKETPNILKNLKIMIGIWVNPKNLWIIIDNGKEIWLQVAIVTKWLTIEILWIPFTQMINAVF